MFEKCVVTPNSKTKLQVSKSFITKCFRAALTSDLPSLIPKSAITQLVIGFKLSSSAVVKRWKK